MALALQGFLETLVFPDFLWVLLVHLFLLHQESLEALACLVRPLPLEDLDFPVRKESFFILSHMFDDGEPSLHEPHPFPEDQEFQAFRALPSFLASLLALGLQECHLLP